MAKTPTPSRRRLSRPARIADLEEATRELAGEYQAWLDALPESFAEAEIADQLSETIGQLEEIADGFAGIVPPVVGAQAPRHQQGVTP